MPKVLITYEHRKFFISDIVNFLPHVQQHVADTLHTGVEGGKLTRDEVEIRVRENGTNDFNVGDFQIEVVANETKERSENLEDRVAELKRLLFDKLIFPEYNGSEEKPDCRLWVRLQRGVYVEA